MSIEELPIEEKKGKKPKYGEMDDQDHLKSQAKIKGGDNRGQNTNRRSRGKGLVKRH